MATYTNFNDVKENSEFLDFIKKEFGITDIEQIADYEQTALLMSFKSHANDLSEADIDFIEEVRLANSKEDMEALNDVELSKTRDFDQLSIEQQIYIAVKTYDAKDNGISLEKMATDLEERLAENITKEQESNQNKENVHKEDTAAFNSKDDIYGAFHHLATEAMKSRNGTAENQVKTEEIRDFVARKEIYLASHPEEKNEVNNQLDKFLNNQDQEKMLWGNELYLIDDAFREAYKKEQTDYLALLADNSRSHDNDNENENENEDNDNAGSSGTPPSGNDNDNDNDNNGPQDTIIVGGIPGDDNSNDDHNDDNGSKPFPQQEYKIIREDIRIRSHDNYDNTTLMYTAELDLLHAKNLIADDEYTSAKATLLKEIRERDLNSGLPDGQPLFQTVSQEDMLKARQLVETSRDKIPQNKVAEYKAELADQIVLKAGEQDRRYATLLTPELTAVAIEGYSEALKNKSLSDVEKNNIETKQRLVVSHGEHLLQDLVNKQGYYFTDITNAADEYDGYMHLADTCEKLDIERKKAENTDSNDEVTAEPHYDQARKLMDEYIKPYDEFYHIPESEYPNKVKNPKDTAIKLTARMSEATKIIDKLEFNEDTLGKEYLEAMKNFRFVESYDAAGKPQYEECIITNGDGKMEVVPGSRLDTALRFAANEGMIQDLGDFDKEINRENILENTRDNAFKTLFAYANSEETVQKGLRENPQKFTDPKYLEDFTRDLMSGDKKVDISPLAHDLALKRQVNNIEVYGNRISGKVGAENAEYLKAGLARQVQKIDGTSKDTKDNAACLKKKAVWRNIGSALISGGVSAAIAFASTKLSLGSALGNAVGISASNSVVSGGIGAELAAGGVNAIVGAVAGAAIATASYFAVKKIAAMTKRQKYGWKDVKQDLKSSAFQTALAAGALGGASVGFATAGCAQCAMACGIGSVAVAGVGRYVRSYKDMRLNGHGKASAFALGALNAISVPLGAKLGYDLAMSGVNPNEQITASAQEAKELYGEHGKNLAQSQKDGWTFDQSNQQQPGYTLLDQSKSSVGPYHHYTNQENSWAEMRNDGIRWSEWLNNGSGGHHVQPDFQNGLGGLNHDQALLNNAIKSLDDAAKQSGNEWMNSLVNGKPESNSQMLFYKLYQMRVLMPNENTQLADGSGTVGDLFNVDANHTVTSVFEKLLQGGKLDAQDLTVLGRVEDHVGGEIHTGVNDMGKVLDVVGATHHRNTPVDSYTFGDKGYDLVNQENTTNLFGKFTRAVQHVPGFGALFFTLPKKVKEFLRPGTKADQRRTIDDKKPIDKPIPPIIIKKKKFVKPIIIKDNKIQQMLNEEYWMIRGYNPAAKQVKGDDGKYKTVEIDPMTDAGYKAYCEKVEQERIADGGKPMKEYLEERRDTYNKMFNAASVEAYMGSHHARLNANILDPVGYHQMQKEQRDLKLDGKKPDRDPNIDPLKLPTETQMRADFLKHRPTSKLVRIMRDAFWRQSNGVDVHNPQQNGGKEGNPVVFSFKDFTKATQETLTRSSQDTERDASKAPIRRTTDEIGKMKRTKQSQR